MILRQQQSVDPDCTPTGSKSRQYNHISGLEYSCTCAARCPYRLISCVLLAQNRLPHPSPLSSSTYNLLLYGSPSCLQLIEFGLVKKWNRIIFFLVKRCQEWFYDSAAGFFGPPAAQMAAALVRPHSGSRHGFTAYHTNFCVIKYLTLFLCF